MTLNDITDMNGKVRNDTNSVLSKRVKELRDAINKAKAEEPREDVQPKTVENSDEIGQTSQQE